MRGDGVLIVMRGEFAGGPAGSWQAMYTQGDKTANQSYRYANWDQLERGIHQLFELNHKELKNVPPALAGGVGSVRIDATLKHAR
jgi:hypothetical protein